MPWTQPRTWQVGETITSSIYNQQIRDNLNDLRAFPISVYASSAVDQTIPNSAITLMTIDQVDHDTHSMADLGNDYLVVPEDGKYVAGMHAFYSNSSVVGLPRLAITINEGSPTGVNFVVQDLDQAVDNPFGIQSIVMPTTKLVIGDIIRAFAIQTTGVSQTLSGQNTFGPRSNGFWAYRVEN